MAVVTSKSVENNNMEISLDQLSVTFFRFILVLMFIVIKTNI